MRTTLLVVVVSLLIVAAVHAQAPISIEWSLGPNMIQADAGGMTGILGDTFIVAGGTFWHTPDAKRFLKWTQLYDINTGKWSMGPDMPREVAYGLAAVYDGKMYVFGGCGQDREPIADCFVLSPVENPKEGEPRFRWSKGPSLPEPLVFPMGDIIGSTLYCVGGARGYDLGDLSKNLIAIDLAHPEAGWKNLRPMPGPAITSYAVAACGGNLYVFGGYRPDTDPPDNVDTAYKYDVAANRWSRIRRMPWPARAQTALAYDDRYIFIFGMYINSAEDTKIHGSDHGNSAAVLLYDTQENTYIPLQPTPFAVCETFFARHGDTLYGAGGEHLYKIRSPYLFIGKIGPPIQEEQ